MSCFSVQTNEIYKFYPGLACNVPCLADANRWLYLLREKIAYFNKTLVAKSYSTDSVNYSIPYSRLCRLYHPIFINLWNSKKEITLTNFFTGWHLSAFSYFQLIVIIAQPQSWFGSTKVTFEEGIETTTFVSIYTNTVGVPIIKVVKVH